MVNYKVLTNSKLLSKNKKYLRIADKILSDSKLLRILDKYGYAEFTGSYALGLLMTADIDIYVLKKSAFNKKTVLSAFNKIVNSGYFHGFLFGDWEKNEHLNFPKGYYIGLKKWIKKEKWKIDIWFIKETEVQKFKYYKINKSTFDERKKLAILKFKEYCQQSKNKIPSVLIYDMVLKKSIYSLTEFKKLTQ